MPIKQKFNSLKSIDFNSLHVNLGIISEYKKNRESRYSIKYVNINPRLEVKLRNILSNKVEGANSFDEYTFDCSEPENDEFKTIEYEGTDFFKIYDDLRAQNPEQDVVEDSQELISAKSYLIILRDNEGIKLIGFKKLPPNWRMKKEKGLIPIMFKENRFEDLEENPVFSISNTVDFIFYDEYLFILSKKLFEAGLNFRNGMINKAEALYQEFEQINYFSNVSVLQNRVGNNMRYLRKMATIKNLGYYNNSNFLEKLKSVCLSRGWNIFENDKINITEENVDDLLVLFQNKRLLSEITDEIFDVESVKLI